MNPHTIESPAARAALPVYEPFEWDHSWIEQTHREDGKRVLYIGDSISRAIRQLATAASEQKLLFDGFATSKALDNPFFQVSLALFGKQLPRIDLILFNNGLHGWHLDDGAEYPRLYEAMVLFLRREFPGIPLVLALTTSVREPQKNQRVLKRNDAVRKIARAYDLPVLDLNVLSAKLSDLHCSDGIHFEQEGYQKLAAAAAEFLLSL